MKAPLFNHELTSGLKQTFTRLGDQSTVGILSAHCILHTRSHMHTLTHTHNQLAAANPEIKASVTDVISGYICDKERKRAEESRGKQHAANIHRAANCYWLIQRRRGERKRESRGTTHHLLGTY